MKGIFLLVVLCVLSLAAHSQFMKDKKLRVDKTSWSRLMCATLEMKHQKIKKLIGRGADINHTSRYGYNALEIAIKNDDSLAVAFLIYSGRLTVQPGDSLYYVNIAAASERSGVFWLVANYFNAFVMSNKDCLPIFSACSFGTVDNLRLLLEYGYDANSVSEVDGMTPLMQSAYHGSVEKVRLLLDYGAISGSISDNGSTALDYLEQSQVSDEVKAEIAKLLQ